MIGKAQNTIMETELQRINSRLNLITERLSGVFVTLKDKNDQFFGVRQKDPSEKVSSTSPAGIIGGIDETIDYINNHLSCIETEVDKLSNL